MADRQPMPATGNGAARVRLLSCVGVELELALLGHFLDHYLDLGIAPDRVHLLLNARDAGSGAFDAADAICAARGVAAGARWIAPYTSDAMWTRRRALQARVAGPGDWIVNADVDELHRYPAPLEEVVAYLEAGRFGAVQGVMIDRLSADGTLTAPAPAPSLAEQYPVAADVSLSVIGTGVAHGLDGTIKLMMHRHDVLPNRGGHTAIGSERRTRYAAGARLAVFPGAADPVWRFGFPFRVDHYKWTATLQRSLALRLATEGVSVAGREYGGRIERYLGQHGRIRLADTAVERKERDARSWTGTLARMRRASLAHKLVDAARRRSAGAIGALRRKVFA